MTRVCADQSAYFITFRTYGTWLHGDVRGSVDRTRNIPRTPFIEPKVHFEQLRRQSLGGEPFVLDDRQRQECETAIHVLAQRKEWTLLAANVRTNHVHVVCLRPIRVNAP
jgi:hypothetical protein